MQKHLLQTIFLLSVRMLRAKKRIYIPFTQSLHQTELSINLYKKVA